MDLRAFLRGEYPLERLKTELDALLQSTKSVNVAIDCKHCERQGKYDIDIPDNRTRLSAIQIISEQGYGKAPQAKEDTSKPVDTSKAVEDYTADERRQAIAQLKARLDSGISLDG